MHFQEAVWQDRNKGCMGAQRMAANSFTQWLFTADQLWASGQEYCTEQKPRFHLCLYGAHSLFVRGGPSYTPRALVGNMRQCAPRCSSCHRDAEEALHSEGPRQSQPFEEAGKDCKGQKGGEPLCVRQLKLLHQRGCF